MNDSRPATDTDMDDLSTLQGNQLEETIIIDKQRQELKGLQEQYDHAVQKMQVETAIFESIKSSFGELVTIKSRLEKEKDTLGIEALEIRDRLKILKRETSKAETQLQQIYSRYEIAEKNKVASEAHLAEVRNRLGVLAAIVESQKQLDDLEIISAPASNEHKTSTYKLERNLPNPWRSGSFYLFAAVVVLVVVAVISVYTSWYTLIVVLISYLLIAVIGALQLRNDKNLSEDNFVKLMVESLKRLPLLRIDNLQGTKLEN